MYDILLTLVTARARKEDGIIIDSTEANKKKKNEGCVF